MKFIKLWAPVILWGGLIFYLSSIPFLKTGLRYDFILRKFAHVFEYFILTLLLYRAFRGTFQWNIFHVVASSSVVSLLYAISDEIHQAFVPGRGCSARDVFIDAIGIAAFFLFFSLSIRDRKGT